MRPAAFIEALRLPAASLVGQRVPKKTLVDQGGLTPTDRRLVSDFIEEITWVAALKPATVGVPSFADGTREYLEIAVLMSVSRSGAKPERVAKVIHRAIPYPLLLVQEAASSTVLTMSHLRRSLNNDDKMVLEGPLSVTRLAGAGPLDGQFAESMAVGGNLGPHLLATYQSWLNRADAYAACRLTGTYPTDFSPERVSARKAALDEFSRISLEFHQLRRQAAKEAQVSRRVDLNLKLRNLQYLLAQATSKIY